MAEMKGVHYGLNSFWFTSRCCGEGQKPEEGIGGHHEANDLGISIIPGSPMGFIDYQEYYVFRIADLVGQIIHERLGCHVEYAFRLPLGKCVR